MLDSTVLDGIGWKVRGDFIAPESHKRGPFFPRFTLFISMLPLLIRYCFFSLKQWLSGKWLFINPFKQMKHNKYTGVPVGGIGCGSIGTDFRGAFNKFSLIPGVKEQSTENIKANQFILTVHSPDRTECIYQSLLSTADFCDSSLSEWHSQIRGEDVRYRGLFPRAWREFRIPDLNLTLICEQISPVIPHNYEVSISMKFSSRIQLLEISSWNFFVFFDISHLAQSFSGMCDDLGDPRIGRNCDKGSDGKY
ncbi:hypothetical protein COOONC_06396 [Cooperia oncophora]